MKKKTLIIVVTIITIILIGLIGYYIYLSNDANEKALKLVKKVKEYEFIEEELKTGKHIDLSKDKIKGINFEINEGKLFVDEDKEITLFSDVVINGLTCKDIFNKPNCSIFNSKNEFALDMIVYKKYNVGDIVTLKDDSKWYVIHDTDEYSKYVYLMQDKRIDINKDGFTVDVGSLSDPDRIPFDKNGSKKYDETVQGSVAYYLENDYRNSMTLNNILDFRLLTLNELEAIKEKINFEVLTEKQKLDMMEAENEILDSIKFFSESPRPFHKLKDIIIDAEQNSKLMPHWLFNSNSGNFWVMDGKKAITATWDGNGYAIVKATTGYGLKPVMLISKDNIKES